MGRTIKIRKGRKELTSAQERVAKEFAQKQIEKYLSPTQFVDDATVAMYVKNAYKAAGQKPPKIIKWFDSPIVFNRHWDSVGTSVGASVWTSVGASVWGSVWTSVGASVGASVWDSVRAYYDADEWSYLLFFNNYLEKNDIVWIASLSENVVGYAFFKDECWLVRKPIALYRDEQGRLHSTTSKAIEFKDGWGFYCYHGVKVSEKVIMHPEKLTKEDWMDEMNAEVRRVIQELMGERFVKEVGGKVISKSKRGELLEIELPNDPEKIAHYVKVKDASTPRVYYLRTPPDIQDVDESIAWTFSMDVKDYQLSQET